MQINRFQGNSKGRNRCVEYGGIVYAVATAEGIRGRFGQRRRAETPGAVGRWVVDARRDAEAMARRPSATDVDLTSSHHISPRQCESRGGRWRRRGATSS